MCVSSRDEAEGADGDSQGAPWCSQKGVQPHQPGAQYAGQEKEEGNKDDFSLLTLWFSECMKVKRHPEANVVELGCDGGLEVICKNVVGCYSGSCSNHIDSDSATLASTGQV